ncbi:MAG: cation diffusion facilitator family transporter [Syntrophorhabdaceae bacterium]|nr:cation diffusion facilitator family transporter [Syntrophorhabdaceae bacterium]
MDTKQKASYFAIASAGVLAAGKFISGFNSGSMAILSSGLDSLLDVFMSIMNLLAIKKATKPADEEHQYGHERTEDIASVLQALLVVISGLSIIYKSLQKFLQGGEIGYTPLDLSVMVSSLFLSLIVSTVLVRTGKRLNSNALKADALHYRSDIYSNLAAILAIAMTYYTGLIHFDLLFAVITGFIIIFSAVVMLKEGVSALMDRRIPGDIERRILDIIETMPFPYAGYHRMRSRVSGNKNYIDFHLLICRKAHVNDAHETADKIEKNIKASISSVDPVIHIEPCPVSCNLTDETCIIFKKRPKKRNESGPSKLYNNPPL